MCQPVKLPRTGIDQVFSGERPRFIEAHREFERIASVNVSNHLNSKSFSLDNFANLRSPDNFEVQYLVSVVIDVSFSNR